MHSSELRISATATLSLNGYGYCRDLMDKRQKTWSRLIAYATYATCRDSILREAEALTQNNEASPEFKTFLRELVISMRRFDHAFNQEIAHCKNNFCLPRSTNLNSEKEIFLTSIKSLASGIFEAASTANAAYQLPQIRSFYYTDIPTLFDIVEILSTMCSAGTFYDQIRALPLFNQREKSILECVLKDEFLAVAIIHDLQAKKPIVSQNYQDLLENWSSVH